MKTRLTFWFILLILFSVPVFAVCTDSDSGQDYFVKGTITSGDLTIDDLCQGDELTEFYCDPDFDEIIDYQYDCPNGCDNGACISASPLCGNGNCESDECTSCPQDCGPAQCNPLPSGCTDSDNGVDVYTQGTTILGDEIKSDECFSATEVEDYYCDTDFGQESIQSRIEECPNGCEGGECIREGYCTDTDGGIVPDRRGEADDSRETWGDVCENNQDLSEAYCDENNALAREIIQCEDKCFDGKCIEGDPQTCYDSDGGIDYDRYGEIFLNEQLVGIDNCKEGEADRISRGTASYLWENYWDADCNQQHELYKCPYICEAGACVKCSPIGFIESNTFCSSLGVMENQKEDAQSCQNDFECINTCKAGICGPLCEGCLNENNICIPFGTRTDANYCDIDYAFKEQKFEDIICNNNYECSTNICVDNTCISSSFIQKIIGWFKRLFGG